MAPAAGQGRITPEGVTLEDKQRRKAVLYRVVKPGNRTAGIPLSHDAQAAVRDGLGATTRQDEARWDRIGRSAAGKGGLIDAESVAHVVKASLGVHHRPV